MIRPPRSAAFTASTQDSGPRARPTAKRADRVAALAESLLLYQANAQQTADSSADEATTMNADHEEASPTLAIDEALALGVSL